MAQASAFATGSACALRHEFVPVVQNPIRSLYRDCTSYGFGDLAEATTTSLLNQLCSRGGGLPPEPVASALQELVNTLAAMADGAAPPHFFLSSLDPGVGKTTTMVHFVQHLLRSAQHDDVAVLLCFSRLEEIARLVAEMDLDEADFAVFTKDDETNRLSSTPFDEARVLFTTHNMIKSRCRGRRFGDVDVFRYRGKVRSVRIWDEEMLPGEVISLNTDQLAALRDPLRLTHPNLAELIEGLERKLEASGGQGTYRWPDVEDVAGVSLLSALRGLEQRHASYLEDLYALSGRCVLLRKHHNASTVITALDSRDAIPDDLAPMMILDASGRVRATYEQWEKATGKLLRLSSAVRSYRNLTVHVMNKGAGKTAWLKDGNALAQEVAQLIDSKPDEEWLVVYHKGANRGTVPDQIKGLLSTNADRVSFLNWGKHQGTNEFRHIQNVILAGMNNYSETDYEMMARYYSRTRTEERVDKHIVREIEEGEHMHHILQALCRSSVRQGSGSECGPCDAYIIAPKRSGVRDLLPVVFPGCRVKTWKATNVQPKGKVQEALGYVEMHFEDHPDQALRFKELQAKLGIPSASNFRSDIRRHHIFQAKLEALDVEEITIGNYRHRNAFAKKRSTFGPVKNAKYAANV